MNSPLIVIVSGGRDFADRDLLRAALDELHAKQLIACVRHGACPTGADALAGQWARERGVQEHRFPAAWRELGPSAGPIRNTAMVSAHPPADICLVFPGGRGTLDLYTKATRHNLVVRTVGWTL